MENHHGKQAVVIGAGIIGMCCARALQHQGFRVTVIDRQEPGKSCSFGNAGAITPSSALPNSLPGVLKKVPGWLFHEEGPLFIHWQYFPRLIPWLFRFLKSANWSTVDETTTALLNLHANSFKLYQSLAKEIDAEDLIIESLSLNVYSSEKDYLHSLSHWKLLKAKGIIYEELDEMKLCQLEPNLAEKYRWGIMIENAGFTSNPFRLVQKLSETFQQNGGVILNQPVKQLIENGDGTVDLITDQDPLKAEKLILAAGAWSHLLVSQLGFKIPLETERGYHVTLNSPGSGPKNFVMEAKHKFIATPMEMGVRFAGTAEFAGLRASANNARSQVLLKLGRRMYPDLQGGVFSEWMGHRPSLPDSRPVIDYSPNNSNIIFAFGHGHRGLIGAPITGQLVAELALSKKTSVDIFPFRITRF